MHQYHINPTEPGTNAGTRAGRRGLPEPSFQHPCCKVHFPKVKSDLTELQKRLKSGNVDIVLDATRSLAGIVAWGFGQTAENTVFQDAVKLLYTTEKNTDLGVFFGFFA